MDTRICHRALRILLAGACIATVVPELAEGQRLETAPAQAANPPAEKKVLPWLKSLAQGYTQAQRLGRPLFVRVGGESCRFCRELAKEIVRPEVQVELKEWVLVEVDVDTSPDDARLLAVGAIPALRLLTSTGKPLATHDGYLKADELLAWLREHRGEAAATPPAALIGDGPLETDGIVTLVREFKNRDAAIREAAIRRLLPYPETAAAIVVSSFSEGSLSTRLAALDLLQEWKAPLEGIDPWRPETITAARLTALADWGAAVKPADGAPVKDRLTPEELNSARELLARLIAVPPEEVPAFRERLARHGRLLLPEVYRAIQSAGTDAERERLTALRYRLVATGDKALGWPTLFDRLAATDAGTRRQAADELAKRATAVDEPLLLELFSDPSPLVREICLRALHQLGGENAHSALVRLLADPEPNVRAAVLKQLSEKPPHTLVPRIVEYLATEQDPDLVVHAIRVLREAGGETAIEALTKLLPHESWQVRAEAVEGLGKIIENHDDASDQKHKITSEQKSEIYLATIKLLKDPDGFVVSRAVGVLSRANQIAAVDPLAAAAVQHPDLAGDVTKALMYTHSAREQGLAHVRRFNEHPDPRLRAAAITALCQNQGANIDRKLKAALADQNVDVRIAAANGFFAMLESRSNIPPGMSLKSTYQSFAPLEEAEDAPAAGPAPAPSPSSRRSAPAPVIIEPDDGTHPDGAEDAPQAAQARAPEAVAPEPAAAEPSLLEKIAGYLSGDATRGNSVKLPGMQMREEPPLDTKRGEYEEFLRSVRAGEVFGDRWKLVSEGLEPLLSAETPDERLAGALALAALGKDRAALPVLNNLVETEPALLPKISKALPWLLSADRATLLERLLKQATSAGDLEPIAHALVRIRAPQSADALWGLLAHPVVDVTAVEGIGKALKAFYFPQNKYQIEKATAQARKPAVDAATRLMREGSRWQRSTAIGLLRTLEPEKVVTMAKGIFADEKLGMDARTEAFRLILATEAGKKGMTLAVANLSSSEAGFQRAALTFLVEGKAAIAKDAGVELTGNEEGMFMRTQQHVAIEPPPGLAADTLRPLLAADDPHVAAQAGYLLALLGEPEGLPPLMAYWQNAAQREPAWSRLVYRAIANLDDATQIPVLKEIYQQLNTDSLRHVIPEFYWTIRVMTGPEILAFRKQIRDEIGMDQLQ